MAIRSLRLLGKANSLAEFKLIKAEHEQTAPIKDTFDKLEARFADANLTVFDLAKTDKNKVVLDGQASLGMLLNNTIKHIFSAYAWGSGFKPELTSGVAHLDDAGKVKMFEAEHTEVYSWRSLTMSPTSYCTKKLKMTLGESGNKTYEMMEESSTNIKRTVLEDKGGRLTVMEDINRRKV